MYTSPGSVLVISYPVHATAHGPHIAPLFQAVLIQCTVSTWPTTGCANVWHKQACTCTLQVFLTVITIHYSASNLLEVLRWLER